MVAGASPSAPALTGDLVSRFSTQVGSDVFEPTHGRSRSTSSSTCCGRSHCSGGYRRNPRLFAALTVSFIGITLALDLYLGLSREVKYDRHEYFGSDTNALSILVGSLLAIVVHNDWAVSDGSVSCSLCAASRCPPARPGISERHLSLLPGDRRGDRTDARDVDRCRDAAAIGRWIAAGKRPNAVAGRAVVFDLSLECPGANRRRVLDAAREDLRVRRRWPPGTALRRGARAARRAGCRGAGLRRVLARGRTVARPGRPGRLRAGDGP